MSRTLFWSVFGLLALAVLGAAWFFTHFDRVPSTTWEKPGKAARRDPYLALERFTERLGRPLTRIGNALDLDVLPPGGALLLDRSRRLHVTPKRAEALLAWVGQGGYLIVAAEDEGVDDPILKRLGVAWHKVQLQKQDVDEAGENAPETIAIRLPGREKPLYLENQSWAGETLQPSSITPVWRAGLNDRHNMLLHFVHGRGQITVLEKFGFLTNRHIGEYDHAELIWALLKQYQPTGALRLATRLEVPTLWEWLAESAWMVLVSGGCLIGAWLWAIVPRFGGLLPVEAPARRSLVEHLAAVGRAVWREGGLVHWSNRVRQDGWESLIRRHPHLPHLAEAERIDTLARLGGLSPEQVAAVLNSGEEISPEAFTEMVRTVQRLEREL